MLPKVDKVQKDKVLLGVEVYDCNHKTWEAEAVGLPD
jgi:hypothetical protein